MMTSLNVFQNYLCLQILHYQCVSNYEFITFSFLQSLFFKVCNSCLFIIYFFNIGNEQNENDLDLEIQVKINTHLLVMNWKGLKYIDCLIFVVTMCNVFI